MKIPKKIIRWLEESGRNLPWRDTSDPYLIWIAEIILQQTRIEQGLKYYYRFIKRFPNIETLAQASQDELLKYWEGLGYYSRARNLHFAAQQLVEMGAFPRDHKSLMKLKGVGPYTARAISSFAFGERVGVLDGNVKRLISRVLGELSAIDDRQTLKQMQATVDAWATTVTDSKSLNHGMMDLGATICKIKNPDCKSCPLSKDCVAYRDGLQAIIPFKAKKINRKTVYFNFYIIHESESNFAIRQRPNKGLWGGLWEIPNEEVSKAEWETNHCPEGAFFHFGFKHIFTHIDMYIRLFEFEKISNLDIIADCKFITKDKITKFAFARAVNKMFEQLLFIEK